MQLMYFTEQPMSAYPAEKGLEFGATALMFSNQVLRSGRRQPALQRIPRALHLCRGDGHRRLYAERAPQCAVLHAGQVQHLCRDPRRGDQKRQDHPARQPAALGREPGAARRGIVDDRHDLARAPGLGLCPRRRPGAARRRRQPGLQPRALSGGARSDRRRVDARGPVPLGGHALSAPRRQSVGGAVAKAASAGVDPGGHQPRDDRLGGTARLSLYRAQHPDRPHQADLEDLRQRRRRGRLYPRPRLSRDAEADPRRRDRGEGARQRRPIQVDAGRIHRPGPSGVEHAVGLRQSRKTAAPLSSSPPAGRKTRATARSSKNSSRI